MTFYIDRFPGREIELEQKKYLYFGGTSYLGLQTDEAFQNIFISNIRKYGTNYGASRKSNIRISIYKESEKHLSRLVGSEACISLSSGYLAGQLVRQFMDTKANRLFYAPNTHSALYSPNPSISKLKPYKTFTALNLAVRDHLKADQETTPVVFLDAIDFSGSNYPDFEGLKMLPLENIILVVDDSHGIGIVGNNGGGVFRNIKDLNPKELIVCCSLGKGFGIQAGTVFGSKIRMEQLVDTQFFGGASPATPAAMASFIDGSEIFKEKRTILKNNIDLFRSNIKALDKFKFMQEHPAFSFSDEELTKYLQEQKVVVTSFRYPDEDSTLMSRIVISAHHTKKDILLLCNLINSYF
ncbi:aminotransferase class I/II-fold pyridoxal phosphate-dependent enzyme [Arenibacter sp. F26102]|uniref:aminotransferase class I/II-fold pyridoxal phosphate-dependent enzyme n=1 Tax=Arenibacter sp. F26102 TaxID=2926416 RepID=UPI001FF362AA|nr:aminotransferase class I/II-fold pyridoxal phosphate-dependent enzyme [Arenibacter sp. F26102]MCK0146588.1 aminotransferase class I/II-fold pyridoxal phosphate-dependent enzyme [Arenibacter sp. F26102]